VRRAEVARADAAGRRVFRFVRAYGAQGAREKGDFVPEGGVVEGCGVGGVGMRVIPEDAGKGLHFGVGKGVEVRGVFAGVGRGGGCGFLRCLGAVGVGCIGHVEVAVCFALCFGMLCGLVRLFISDVGKKAVGCAYMLSVEKEQRSANDRFIVKCI